MISKILLLFISMPSFYSSPYLFLSYTLELYTVFRMSYIFLSILMHFILTEQCSYIEFVIEMVVCIKIACLIAACGETMLQFLGVLCAPGWNQVSLSVHIWEVWHLGHMPLAHSSMTTI